MRELWIQRSKDIQPLDSIWRQKARQRLKEQTRPEGSLGYLETLIEKIVAIQKKDRPSLGKKKILIFAGDHGVEAEGVSLFPRDVTKAMVMNFLNGGATINALARHVSAEVEVIDVGVDGHFEDHPCLRKAKIRPGTRNIMWEAARTAEELDQALTVGWEAVHQARASGVDILGIGEMGIGNTTAASAVIAGCLHQEAQGVTGRGTGLDDQALEHKIRVIDQALVLHKTSLGSPLGVLQCLGGYEIAAMTGAILACAHLGLPLVIDGWVVAAAVLVAFQLNPVVLEYIFMAHQSQEKGHRLILEAIKTKPILDLSMRLGEASGAALAMGILEAGGRVYNEVATFAEAKVGERKARD